MKKAFTLIELVVVVSVIAVLTHLAVRELWHVRQARLLERADEQMEEIRSAVYACSVHGRDAAGFLCDMGRMPAAADGTLGELWLCPTNSLVYGVRPATAENLVPAARHLADASIYVPTGWRGPYMRPSRGAATLLDPWGNKIETIDDAGLRRLWTTNGYIMSVAHYGASATVREASVFSIEPDGGSESTLVLQPESLGGTFSGEITYRWYGPADGMVTGALARAVYPAPVVFKSLTPGRRVVVDSVTSTPRIIDILPGDNLISIKLP